MPPSEFIPVAEDMGLIIQLGEWALRRACMEAVEWPDDIRVSVNLSPLQFAKGNLVSTVVSALASSGLPASRLELEITESVLLEKSERNIAILNQLRELGVRISMDDFGTGYSSIGYLRSSRSTRSRSTSRSCATCSSTRAALPSFARSPASASALA